MKNNKYQAVIFDLDGTLFDTSPSVLSCVDYTIASFDLPALSENKRRLFIGPPLKQSFLEICHMPDELATQAVAVFRKHYETELCNAIIYPGILELLQSLKEKNILVGIATNKIQPFADTIIDHFELRPYFDCIKGADPKGHLTKTDVIKLCLEEMHITSPHSAILIGDSKFDAIGANAANIDFIGVTYGFGFKTSLDVDAFPNVLSTASAFDLINYF